MLRTADRRMERLCGAYYRAYVEQAEGELVGATALLTEIRAALADEATADEVVRLRVERLYARVLLHAGDPGGRKVVLDALASIGGIETSLADADPRLASALSDFCVELNAIGAHDEAVAIMRRTLAVAGGAPIRAVRLTNLSSYLVQRATVHRVEGRVDAAREDLVDALDAAREAVAIRRSLTDAAPEHYALALRQSQTELMAATVERAGVEDLDLEALYASACIFVRETLDDRRDPAYDLATRIGRLGSLRLRCAEQADGSERRVTAAHAEAYLHYGWDLLSRSYLRAWLAVDRYDALRLAGNQPGARHFAALALSRLEVQCGSDYPPCRRLAAGATD
jgi:hypothetical protein